MTSPSHFIKLPGARRPAFRAARAACGLLLAVHACLLLPAPARAALKLAYCRDDGRHWQVWLAEPDGNGARALTDSSWDKRTLRTAADPARLLSRDNEGRLHELALPGGGTNRQILNQLDVVKDFDFTPRHGFLISSYAPNSLDNVVVWHCAADGSGLRLLNRDPFLNEMPRWLPDGSGFVYVRSHGPKSVLCRADASGGNIREVLPGVSDAIADPCPDPTGRWIAFCRERDKNMDLWVARLDGSDARSVHAGPGLEAEPAWSPDGNWIYFATADAGRFRIARVGRDGRGLTHLTPSDVDARCPVLLDLKSN